MRSDFWKRVGRIGTSTGKLHWVLDVAFDEDQSRIRSGYAPENMAVLRRLALGPLAAGKNQFGGRQKQPAQSRVE